MLQIYKASAGSGKTYKLAYEYIRALLGVKPQGNDAYYLCLPKYGVPSTELSNRHRYILAITFTNKATEEMKRRIIDELDDLSVMPKAADDEAEYAPALCKEFGCSRQELAEVAHRALHQLLQDYNSFNVTTIDSFFQKVLRTFARELDRQGDFNVELNDIAAVQTAVAAMIDDFNAEPDAFPLLGKWIYEYMSAQIEEGKKSNFFNRKSSLHTGLVKLVAKICDERFKPYSLEMQQLLADPNNLLRLKKRLSEMRKDIVHSVQRECTSTISQLEAGGVDFKHMNGKLSFTKLLNDKLLHGIAVDNVKDVFYSKTYAKLLDGESKLFNKKANATDADVSAMIDLLKRIRALYADYKIIANLNKSVDLLMLLGHAWGYLNDFVAQNNVVLLSDTNHLLSRIIGHDETPFIYERMGVQLRHFLIDEFQDTSKMQWQNLKPLVANSLDNDFYSLIIGDEKQSIYRFRNSDSSLLHTQVANVDFPSGHYDTRIEGDKAGQNTNYRSASDVVAFNNTLFSRLAALKHIEGFENVIQDIAKKNRSLPGYVEFVPVLPPPKDSNNDSQADDPDQEPPEEINVIDLMAQNIQRQHDEGHYDWGDIAVLVSYNSEGSKVVERFIARYPNIPIISDESLFLRKSPAIQLIVGVLEILSKEPISRNPDGGGINKYPTASEVALAISRFSYYLNEGLPADKAMDMAVNTPTAQSEQVSAKLVSSIEAVRQRKPSSLVALVETIVHELIPVSERLSQISFINAFQDYLIEFCSHYNPSLTAFLNKWAIAKNTLSVSSAANINAVKVMTIHKSKGLEFDCVHIPFGAWPEDGKPGGRWQLFPSISGIEPEICPPVVFVDFSTDNYLYDTEDTLFYNVYNRDLYERRVDTMNVTYVAYTRAKRELIVYGNPSDGMLALVNEVMCNNLTDVSDDYRLCRLADYYNPETKAFVLGNHTVKEIKEDDAESDKTKPLTVKQYNVIIHKSTEVLTRAEDMLDLNADIEQVSADPLPDDRYMHDDEARRRGVMLHDTLSAIDTIDDIDKAVQNTRRNLRLTADEAAELRAKIAEMLNADDVRIRRWFVNNDGVMTEQSIYLPLGDPRRGKDNENNRRPDRIVINTDGSVDVVDYKFTTDTLPSHRSQIIKYMSILHDMGYEQVRGYLWYPFVQKITEVTEI